MTPYSPYYLHAYARGVDKRTTYLDNLNKTRFLFTLVLAIRPKSPKPSILIEHINNNIFKPHQFTQTTLNRLYGKPIINIISAVLMPNHFHLHLSYKDPKEYAQVFQRLIGGYTKYFNARHQREGHLYSSTTKTVKISSDEQNIYLSKYIHLNPIHPPKLTATFDKIDQYPWSTYNQYLGKPSRFTLTKGFFFDTSFFCNPKPILKQFASSRSYQNFLLEPANFSEKLNNKELIDQPNPS